MQNHETELEAHDVLGKDGLSLGRVKGIFFLTLIVACSGCINISTHVNGNVKCVYPGTVMGLEMCAFHPPIIPPIIIDLPFEIVADTITLPYDVFQ